MRFIASASAAPTLLANGLLRAFGAVLDFHPSPGARWKRFQHCSARRFDGRARRGREG
jgi:hypothetical protein